MKRLLLIALLVAPGAFAQAATPCDTQAGTGLCLSWQAPVAVPGVTVASYNVYQILQTGGTCGGFLPGSANRIASGVTLKFFLQTTYANAAVCNEVTAVSSAGVEGPPSAVNQFPLPIPGAPQAVQAVIK